MQEIKNAYKQQNRKLSEFVDFVKRYFQYLEKLMPTIMFLHDTLNFDDGLIRKLCAFMDISIKGDLYSLESSLMLTVRSALSSKIWKVILISR